MTEPAHKAKSNKAAIGGGIAAVAIVVVLFVPLIPISYEETYQTTQTKRTSYQELENKQNTLFSVNDITLQGGQTYMATAWVEAGHRVEFTASASDTVDTYVYSGDGRTINSREDTANARYGFTAPIGDNYQFAIFNEHDGFFGLGAKNVGVYSASATENYEELVTKYRDTTEPVTEKRTINKNITLLEMLTSPR